MKLVSVRNEIRYIEAVRKNIPNMFYQRVMYGVRHKVYFHVVHIRDRVVDEFFKKIRERR